jgi:hypothetical protein
VEVFGKTWSNDRVEVERWKAEVRGTEVWDFGITEKMLRQEENSD